MDTREEKTERPTVPPLTRPELGLAGFGAFAAAGVGALGLVSSFDAVSEAAGRWGFSDPWMLPVGIDIAIPVFTVANLLLIRMDMALGWVRWVPWVLTLVTCSLNIAAGQSLSAKLAHGTMPLLWVVFSEIGAHIYAVRIGAATGRRMEKIRLSRWVWSPWATLALKRRMDLWEITSYTEALVCERERQLARAELRQRHGRRWRSQTPRTERVLLKLGELAPAGQEPAAPTARPEPPADAAPVEPRPKTPRTPRKSARPKASRSAADLLAEAREKTAAWPDKSINAEAVRTALHCSAGNARTLRDTLLSERADTGTLHAVDAHEVADDAQEVAA